jgi:hypothetical protein
MPGPFIFVATNKVREGRLEGEKQRVPGWIEFIHSNEPRLIAFHEYLSEDGTEVEYVQVHPDTDSFENHMRVVERSGRAQQGDPGDAGPRRRVKSTDDRFARTSRRVHPLSPFTPCALTSGGKTPRSHRLRPLRGTTCLRSG